MSHHENRMICNCKQVSLYDIEKALHDAKTIIDVEHATPEDLAAVKLEDYNQVLIGVSVDTFMHEDMHTVLSSYLPQAGETAGN